MSNLCTLNNSCSPFDDRKCHELILKLDIEDFQKSYHALMLKLQQVELPSDDRPVTSPTTHQHKNMQFSHFESNYINNEKSLCNTSHSHSNAAVERHFEKIIPLENRSEYKTQKRNSSLANSVPKIRFQNFVTKRAIKQKKKIPKRQQLMSFDFPIITFHKEEMLGCVNASPRHVRNEGSCVPLSSQNFSLNSTSR
ncbi:hypothetical protein C9374_000886 [Naegleria lovaniensis]|uniref:Uncharacterized protein n=1 Tax=Naegleria lovaniensis TaxID=51637 RepID=A0AA88GTD1_NAELO|nr:uncharacterized protein C9374_000886 [Naegleria lovaniensis]KAG2388036.1 hypothetical protein C9374_000886 [Naegleria lovaniensis]